MNDDQDMRLRDPATYPDEAALERALGSSYGAYRELLAWFATLGLAVAWTYYRDGSAWLGKAQKGAKGAAWLSAWGGYFRCTVYVPLSKEGGLYALSLPPELNQALRGAKPLGKSKPCVLDVRSTADLAAVRELVAYKLSLR